eukprot:PhM_4_TR9996/c0_g1_i1/m.103193
MQLSPTPMHRPRAPSTSSLGGAAAGRSGSRSSSLSRPLSARTQLAPPTPRPPPSSGAAAASSARFNNNPTPQEADMIDELNEVRARAAECGNFAEAQRALDTIRQTTESRGHALQEALESFRTTKLDDLVEQQRRDLMHFTHMWEQKMSDYEARADAALASLKEEHANTLRENEGLLRAELSSRKVHYSRHTLNMKDAIRRLSDARHYKEAEDVQKRLRPIEKEELRKFDEKLSVEFAAQSKRWREQCRKEMASLRYKTETGLSQLKEQRRQDYERLILKHHNAITETEQKTKTKLARASDAVKRQLRGFQGQSRRTGVKFVEFDDILASLM